MQKSLTLTGISLAVTTVFPACTPKEKEKVITQEPPNIIFIISEDNSPFLGCYGDKLAHTPNLDKLAGEGVLYENAFACAPVSAPSRSSLITGMYANSLGTHHMRCRNAIPRGFHFFPYYLKQAGYYTANRIKKDYNIPDQQGVWDVDDWWEYKDMLKKRKKDQPFFVIFNTFMSHESKIHGTRKGMLDYYKNAAIESMTGTPASQARIDSFNYMHQPGDIPVPPYHPPTDEMKTDWARYYDCISMMDDEVGELLNNLKRDSLLENTIVFYFSDHGGVIGRSKRFVFESGLHVPFIVRFPKKYYHFAPAEPGSRISRIISFIDLAPTVLNLAGIEIPENFQGKPFLGPNSEQEREYAFSFRGRMDERYDFARTVRSKKFRYIRNYMPHRIWGQHINYLWKAKSMQSWEEACKSKNCNEKQARFWGTKPAEELYEISSDPHNVNNLVNDSQYKTILEKMRQANDNWLTEIKDKNFIPEGEYLKLTKDTNGYEYFSSENYNFDTIKKTAEIATSGDAGKLNDLIEALQNSDPLVRYWGAVGCCVLKDKAAPAKELLLAAVQDSSLDLRIVAAEALYNIGEKASAKKALKEILQINTFTKWGPMEMIRCHAFNVVDLMDKEDKIFFENEIKTIAGREEKGYDKRMAEYLITQGIF